MKVLIDTNILISAAFFLAPCCGANGFVVDDIAEEC
jgi:predicted nucleic acid-binding protein